MVQHEFGGDWTEQKLERLRKYLPAYMKIMKAHPAAREYLKAMYIDAFAGTGYITPKQHKPHDTGGTDLFAAEDEAEGGIEPLTEPETRAFLDGSARIALETQPSFDLCVFIDKNIAHIRDLELLSLQYRNADFEVDIRQGDANSELIKVCRGTNWKTWRAVVFLDPYGMQVDWHTIEVLGKEAKVDLWFLFPLSPLQRMLTTGGLPPAAWSARIDRALGTEDWQTEFYKSRRQLGYGNLFELEGTPDPEFDEPTIKVATAASIGSFVVERLKSVFEYVVENPLPLLNSQNSPLYLLCFASQNDKALKIAGDLMKQ
jgi:three-Cys-motif partner protein